MHIPVAIGIAGLALLLTAWAVVRAVRDRPVVLRQLWAAAVVEAAIIVQVLVAIAVAVGGEPILEPGTFWGYAVATLLILPIAAAWSFAERTRWSSVVLVVAGVTVAFLQWRLLQTWGAA